LKIDHVAIWTNHLEQMKEFYVRYFQASAGSKYVNTTTQFESYFLSFSVKTRIELMSRPGITETIHLIDKQMIGYAHISFACGSEKSVDLLTKRLISDGYRVVDGPRRTGDGYYESVVLDPDGNRVEITI
jgi:lactoylglutathione lyase